MACSATLKRSVKLNAVFGPQSPKRRRCEPLHGATGSAAAPRRTVSPPRPAAEHRLTPGLYERSDPPAFSLRQVGHLCEQLASDHELKVREEYEKILHNKLSEQYESFVKFTQDLILQRYGGRPATYVS